MGDVAQILAGAGGGAPSAGAAGARRAPNSYPPPPPPPPPRSVRPAAPFGLSREVLEILTEPRRRAGDVHAAPLPPVVPSLGFAAARYAAALSGRPVGGAKQPGDGGGDGDGDGDGDAIMEDAAGARPEAPKAGPTGDGTSAGTAAGPPPTIPRTVKVGNRTIASGKPARSWEWAPFSSSARTDGAKFFHWVRSGVEYPDYPYARFDVHLDPLAYTDDEYVKYLDVTEENPAVAIISKAGVPVETKDSETTRNLRKQWTRSETDRLIELARVHELRWAVIHDRWVCSFGRDHRTVEELMHRYYAIGSRLSRLRVQQAAAAEAQAAQTALRGIQQAQQQQQAAAVSDPTGAAASLPPVTAAPDGRTTEDLIADRTVAASVAQADPRYQPPILSGGTGTTNKNTFDLDAERERRRQLDLLWYRPKDEELEEEELRAELRLIEAQLRKIKKSRGHVLAAKAGGGGGAAAAGGGGRAPTPLPPGEGGPLDESVLDTAFASTAPVPAPGTPYLQSGRLDPPAAGGPSGLNKTLLKRMDAVLVELSVPEKPLPTKRVCDLYDSVRKDTVALITLQKMCMRKEQEVHGRRARLIKLGGSLVAATAAAASAAAAAAASTVTATTSPPLSSTSGIGAGTSSAAGSSTVEKRKSSSKSKSSSKKSKTSKSSSGRVSEKDKGDSASTATDGKKKSTKRKKKLSADGSSSSRNSSGKGGNSSESKQAKKRSKKNS